MKEKELRRMSRSELLQMLIDRTREIERLQEQLKYSRSALEKAQGRLADRALALEKAGSIAEAAVKVNRVFEDAQKAAEDYLNGIRNMQQEQEKTCARMLDETRQQADEILDQARAKSAQMEADAQRRCEELLRTAEQDANRKWDDMNRRLEQLSGDQAAMREILSGGKKRKWL